MPWIELTLEVDAAAAEAFSDALLEAGADCVSLEEPPAPGGRQHLSALLAACTPAGAVMEKAARAAAIAVPGFSTASIEEQDWVTKSQSQFAATAIGRLWIGPRWLAAPDDAQIVVHVDPGLAFGTGSHPTTRLALAYLEQTLRPGARVLDYGCGSGILAIAAAKLGAAQVDAVDIDAQAVETARANASANGVLVRAMLSEEFERSQYDLVVSNILAQPLIILAPLLAAATAPGGCIALAGVLETQAAEVSAVYRSAFEMRLQASAEGWALLGGVRR